MAAGSPGSLRWSLGQYRVFPSARVSAVRAGRVNRAEGSGPEEARSHPQERPCVHHQQQQRRRSHVPPSPAPYASLAFPLAHSPRRLERLLACPTNSQSRLLTYSSPASRAPPVGSRSRAESPAATGDPRDSHPWLGTPGVGAQHRRCMCHGQRIYRAPNSRIANTSRNVGRGRAAAFIVAMHGRRPARRDNDRADCGAALGLSCAPLADRRAGMGGSGRGRPDGGGEAARRELTRPLLSLVTLAGQDGDPCPSGPRVVHEVSSRPGPLPA